MLEKRSWYIMGAKKISKKSSGRPPFWAKRFLALIGPWRHPEWPKSKKFFAKQTSMMFLTNDHSPILVFWLNLSSRAITKKVPKMPKFKNGTALSSVFPDSALKISPCSGKFGSKKSFWIPEYFNSKTWTKICYIRVFGRKLNQYK